jgi:hypothetical protein
MRGTLERSKDVWLAVRSGTRPSLKGLAVAEWKAENYLYLHPIPSLWMVSRDKNRLSREKY